MVDPLVKDAYDWRHVLERFFDGCPAATATQALLERARKDASELWAPICVAWWLTAFFDLASLHDELRIAVLGCETMDTALDGRLYALVPWFLGKPSLNVSAVLVGPYMPPPSRARLDRFGFAAAPRFRMRCGRWWARCGAHESPPDLFVMFHPGMESQARSWMQADELPVLLQAGIPAAVFSYDPDEGERDAALMAAFGAVVTSDVRACPLAIRSPHPDIPGGSVFSGAAFAVTGCEPRETDERLVRDIEQLSKAIRQVYEDRRLTERHADAFRHCYVERDGTLHEVLRVFDWIYFDPTSEDLFIAQGGRHIPASAVLHVEGLLDQIRSATTPLQRACLAASIYHHMTDADSVRRR